MHCSEKINEELKRFIKEFVSEESYRRWSQVYQDDDEMEVGEGCGDVISIDLIKAQCQLAESWRALLLVAVNYHVSCVIWLCVHVI